jgi:hypothetical protein
VEHADRASAPATVDDPVGLAADLIENARTLVRRGWCQGTCARDDRGAPVVPWSGSAAAWSAMGALTKEWYEKVEQGAVEWSVALTAFRYAGVALAEAVAVGPQTWNDDEDRTSREVIAALEHAARTVRARSGTP